MLHLMLQRLFRWEHTTPSLLLVYGMCLTLFFFFVCVVLCTQLRFVVDGVASNWTRPFQVRNVDSPTSIYPAWVDIGKLSRAAQPTPPSQVDSLRVNIHDADMSWAFNVTNSFGLPVPSIVYVSVRPRWAFALWVMWSLGLCVRSRPRFRLPWRCYFRTNNLA